MRYDTSNTSIIYLHFAGIKMYVIRFLEKIIYHSKYFVHCHNRVSSSETRVVKLLPQSHTYGHQRNNDFTFKIGSDTLAMRLNFVYVCLNMQAFPPVCVYKHTHAYNLTVRMSAVTTSIVRHLFP